MKTGQLALITGLLFLCTTVLPAAPPREKALWIEVTEKEGHKTAIAVTEFIARQVLESDGPGHHFAKGKQRDLITRDMVRAVLDGDEESVEARDEDGSEVKLYMADLDVPGGGGGGDKLIVETYKSGSRTFRMTLPEIEIEGCDDESCETGRFEIKFGWTGLLPFLAEEGGAIYVLSDDGETEVWVYVE